MWNGLRDAFGKVFYKRALRRGRTGRRLISVHHSATSQS